MKQETLQRLGHDEKALLPVDENVEQASETSSQLALLGGGGVVARKASNTDYLKKGR